MKKKPLQTRYTKKCVSLTKDCIDRVQRRAKKEGRDFSNMLRIIIQEMK